MTHFLDEMNQPIFGKDDDDGEKEVGSEDGLKESVALDPAPKVHEKPATNDESVEDIVNVINLVALLFDYLCIMVIDNEICYCLTASLLIKGFNFGAITT